MPIKVKEIWLAVIGKSCVRLKEGSEGERNAPKERMGRKVGFGISPDKNDGTEVPLSIPTIASHQALL